MERLKIRPKIISKIRKEKKNRVILNFSMHFRRVHRPTEFPLFPSKYFSSTDGYVYLEFHASKRKISIRLHTWFLRFSLMPAILHRKSSTLCCQMNFAWLVCIHSFVRVHGWKYRSEFNVDFQPRAVNNELIELAICFELSAGWIRDWIKEEEFKFKRFARRFFFFYKYTFLKHLKQFRCT